MNKCKVAGWTTLTYRLTVSSPGGQVNVVHLCFEDGPSLGKGHMRRVMDTEGEGLREAFWGRPEEAAGAGGGVLGEGVHQLRYALMKLKLRESIPLCQQQ